MLLIDFGALWILTYLLVRMLNLIPSIWEKAALAFALSLGLKSLVLFFWMAGFGEFPNARIQTGLSLGTLIFVAILSRLRQTPLNLTSSLPQNKSLFVWLMLVILGILLAFSFKNALFFPITEADGIWYHIKGMVFLHEGTFDSETIISQLRQYPPLLSLLFAYLMSFDIEKVKIIFPFIYLCLLVIFYFRTLACSNNKNMAAAFTILLGSTPYFWWHSFLPFLDMVTGFFYSTGAIYWFFLIRNIFNQETIESDESKSCAWAVLSGTLFGLAAWNRLEFLLYNAIPLFLLIIVLDQNTDFRKRIKNKILLCMAVPLLLFSTVWFLTLLNFDSPLDKRVLAVGGVCLGMWVLVFLNLKLSFKLSGKRLIGFGVLAAGLYLTMMTLGGPQNVSLGKALLITCIRSVSVHVFYLGTFLLVLFLFKEKLRSLSEPVKLLGWFLIFYPLVHFLIFSYSEPKWTELTKYLDVLLVHPGHSINLSDTRGMLAFYPVFIFFIAGLPMLKRGFENE